MYSENTIEPLEILDLESQQQVDDMNRSISYQIDSVSNYLDTFFFDDRYNEERKGSMLRLRLGMTLDQHGEVDLDPKIQLHLQLPRTEGKLDLLVANISQAADFTDQDDVRSQDTDDSVGVGLRYFILDDSKYSFNVSSGLRFSGGLNPLVKSRLHRRWIDGDWAYQPTQFVFWELKDGFGTRSRMDVDYTLPESQLARNRFEVTFSEDSVSNNDGIRFENRLSWIVARHNLKGIRLQHLLKGVTQPKSTIDEHFISLLLRQAFHKRILYFELEPGVRFLREDGFDSTFEITLRIEANFSKDSFKFK